MADFTGAEVAAATSGRLHQSGANARLVGVSTDSRTAQTGQLYIPLRGERFDGHDFIPGALRRGVSGLLLSETWQQRQRPQWPAHLTVVTVPDTLKALGDLAAWWRERFAGPVVAVTGSCGKTTTKEMIAAILARRYPVLKNELNLNNLIGLPLTLLELAREHQVAVVEMGMNRFGEIRRLARIAQPDILVLTNVHAAHLEGVGSLAGVAQAKTEALEGLRPGGVVIYNGDDPYLQGRLADFPGRTLSYGLQREALLRAVPAAKVPNGQEAVCHYRGQSWRLTLPLRGIHQLYNALAATAVGLLLGLTPEEVGAALQDFQPLERRSQWLAHDSGLCILNDCYNANPGSMAMALRTLAAANAGGRLLAALGDMLELGPATPAAHREIGALAAQLGYAHLILYGNFKHYIQEGAVAAGLPAHRIHLVADHAAGAAIVKKVGRPGDYLLIKGSRGARMERLLAEL